VLGVLWFFPFQGFVGREARTLFPTYSIRRKAEMAANRRKQRFAALTPEQSAPRLDDPAVRKFTRDVLDAGFDFVGDVASVPLDRAEVIYRIFHAPDRVTSMALICYTHNLSGGEGYAMWPAMVTFECQTFFSDGGRIDSVNHGSHPSYAREHAPSTRLLAFPDATDPVSLYRAHRAAVDAAEGETSATPLRHEAFDIYLRRQEAISEAEVRGFAAHSYSWWDHLRWYLQIDAKPSTNSK
jgi:hypothetical protein